MAKYVTTCILKAFEPGNRNRDNAGNAKTIFMDGVLRARLSSQAYKHSMRIRSELVYTANLERLVRKYLDELVKNGEIEQDEVEAYLPVFGEVLGFKVKTKKNESDEADEAGNEKKTKKSKKDESDETGDEKGSTVVRFEVEPLKAAMEAVIDYFKVNKLNVSDAAKSEKKVYEKMIVDAVKYADSKYEKVIKSVFSALFGAMSTSGVTKTIYGAVKMSDFYSVDAYKGERDYWVAKHYSVPQDGEGSFYKAFNEFSKEENSKPNAETIGETDIYSNEMFGHMVIDLRCALNNMLDLNCGEEKLTEDECKVLINKGIQDCIESYIWAIPYSMQTSRFSAPIPDCVYVEVVDEGIVYTPSFTKVISGQNVTEKAIKRFVDFANAEEDYRTNVKRYVVLSHEYKAEMAPLFEEAGVTVLKNVEELKKAVGSDISEIYK